MKWAWLLLLVWGSGWAETFYVRPATAEYGAEDGTSYATAFDGFSDIAWATTDTAGSVDAGDTLVICGSHSGVTLELTTAQGEGSSGNPITLDFTCSANSDSGSIATAGAVDYGLHLAAGVDYITVLSPAISGVTTTVSGEQALITSRDGVGIILTSPTVSGNTAGPGIRLRKCQTCTLTSPISYNNGTHGIILTGDGSRNATNITITSPVVYGNSINGIKITGSSAATDVQNVTVTDPLSYENGDGLYSIFATNVKFIKQSGECVIRDNTNTSSSGEGYGIGIQQTHGARVEGCLITDNRGDGIEVWGNSSVSSLNAHILRNYISGHTNPIVDESLGNGIECRTGYSTCFIRGNILDGNRKNLRLGNSPSATSEATNNTLSGGVYNLRFVDSNEAGTNAVTGWVFKNNVSISPSSHHVYADVTAGNSVTFGFDNYYGGSAFYYNDTTYTESSWSSIESSRIASDPLLVGGPSPDSPPGFRLTCASPLRNAGTDVGRVQDYGNRLFRIGTPSIGAWEHAEGDERCTITERTTSTARTTVTPRTTITPR